MYEKLQKIREDKAEREGGFTLIELLVVVVIIGILIAIAIPLYLNYQKGASDKSAQSDLRGAVSTLSQCYTDNANAYPDSVTFAGSVGTPVTTANPGACASDLINLSSGTTMTYALNSSGGGYTITDYNSGGHRGAGNPYMYNSAVGGSIG